MLLVSPITKNRQAGYPHGWLHAELPAMPSSSLDHDDLDQSDGSPKRNADVPADALDSAP